MKTIKLLALTAITAVTVISCQKNEITEEIEQQKLEPTQEQLDQLLKIGVNNENVTLEDITLLDGVTQRYLVSGDISIPVSDLDKYVNKMENNTQKQYRTPFIVSPPNRTIDIIGYTGACCALTSKMQTALRWAVNNYNRLNTSLRFRLTFGTNFIPQDIVVYNNNQSGGGGSAGFPTPAGLPYKYIQINAGTDNFSTNVVEHVMTHEIGHCVGFRHQDWFNRQSCGYVGPLPAESPAILIPGTPPSSFADSVMLACFNANEDGEFTATDIQALNILY